MVFVYQKAQDGWQRTGKIGGLSKVVNSLALSADGGLLAIGLSTEDGGSSDIDGDESDKSATWSGAVYLYRRNDDWQQDAYIKASNAQANHRFGFSVALSADGTTLAVGAPVETGISAGVGGDQTARDESTFSGSGATYVFVNEGGSCSQ